ncbi:MAG TPA: hypothetical protein VMH81_06045 [Bryobacteraceae bacterium]|nr:hypothetical protein [Bryobacteraceae bacterium]
MGSGSRLASLAFFRGAGNSGLPRPDFYGTLVGRSSSRWPQAFFGRRQGALHYGLLPQLSRAAEWFLRSGIQETTGGVARYYRSDLKRNQPISTEITGYGVSALVYLHSLLGDERHLVHALAAARFLTGTAWDRTSQTMPFEMGPAAPAYFFDCGIVVRGLLSAWRASGEEEFLETAAALGRSMVRDFASSDGFHPILSLPDKGPLPRDPQRWSRSPGCYQLKSAMAWWDLAEATGDRAFREPYERALTHALQAWGVFLPGHPEKPKVMDRLHAFLYFLEGLLPRAGDPQCAAALCGGIRSVAQHLREIAPEFERSDVYAQLLRIRLYAAWAGVSPLDREAAQFEAERLAGFQIPDSDPRVDGGFCFGRAGDTWSPHVSPVSTAFALQALTLWDAFRAGGSAVERHLLI